MPEDRRIVISSEPTLSPDEITRRTFGTSFRGFDPTEVRTYLRKVSEELGGAQEREKELRRLLAVAERNVDAPQMPDEATLTRLLGEETARVLQSAREAAAEITARAEEKVGRLLREAQDEAARVRREAESVLARRVDEAEEVAAGIRRAAEEEVEAVRSRARAEAEAEIEAARARGREMVAEAQSARERLLTDLSRRRRLAQAQIEQLRAGRERLLEAYRVVRRTLDEVTEELTVAEAEARQAASAAARRAAAQAEASPPSTALTVAELEPAAEGAAPVATGVAEAPPETPPQPVAAPVPHEPVAAPVTHEPVAAPVAPGPAPVLAAVEAGPPDEGVGVLTGGDGDESRSPVDDLFARIRASRADAVSRAQDVLAATDPAAEASSPAAPPPERPVADDDEAALQRRDRALEPLEANLARRLKRTLQDEQNATLDAMRTLRGRASVETILPPVAEQAQRYCSVALPLLDEAHAAGTSFAGGGDGADSPGVADLAEELASELVGPLRDRIGRCLQEAAEADDDEGGGVERISGAYREWKTQRIERLARHHLAAAFGRGSFAAAGSGVGLRWVVEDEDGPCPDCDDNALAGSVPKGERFPTGQSHPPAHAGCRCLVVASPA